MADTPKHSVSVAGIVVDEQDQVLVIQRRDNGHWEPPGGVLELDEPPQVGVVREVYEETGLTVEVVSLSGIYKNMTRGVIALVFRCRALTRELPSGTAEATKVQWHSTARVLAEMSEAYAVRVMDALEDGPTKVRIHDGVQLLHVNLSSPR